MKTCIMHRSHLVLGVVLTVAAAACSKPEPTAAPDPSATTISITATPPASVSSSASAAAPAKPAPTTKSALAPTPASAATAPAPAPPPLKPAATRLSGKNFTLDAASPGCRVDVACVVTLRLSASGEYHVNKEYPYKFTATPTPGVQFLGNGDPNLFTRAAGDFREEGEKAATMTVRFKPTAAGDARISGTYKMSVCSAENCQIESQPVSLAVPVQ